MGIFSDAANLATQSGAFGSVKVILNLPQILLEQLCLSPDRPVLSPEALASVHLVIDIATVAPHNQNQQWQ